MSLPSLLINLIHPCWKFLLISSWPQFFLTIVYIKAIWSKCNLYFTKIYWSVIESRYLQLDTLMTMFITHLKYSQIQRLMWTASKTSGSWKKSEMIFLTWSWVFIWAPLFRRSFTIGKCPLSQTGCRGLLLLWKSSGDKHPLRNHAEYVLYFMIKPFSLMEETVIIIQ